MKPKKAFIFGGNGQIGAAVVQVTIATVYLTRPYMVMYYVNAGLETSGYFATFLKFN